MAKIYGIKNIGKHILEVYTNLPLWSPEDEGRIIYVSSENRIYYANNTEWSTSIGDSGYSGYSGKEGISGYSGYSGFSGYSGKGLSGYSGYSGGSFNWKSAANTTNLNKGFFTLPGNLIVNYGYYDTSAMTSRRVIIDYLKPFEETLIMSNVSMVRKNNPYYIGSGGYVYSYNALDWLSYAISYDVDNQDLVKQQLNVVFGGLVNQSNSNLAYRSYSGFYWIAIGI